MEKTTAKPALGNAAEEPRRYRVPRSCHLLICLWVWLIAAIPAYADSGRFKVPLTTQGNWQILQYSSIPANAVKFCEQGLLIRVDASASPLIYPLSPRQVNTVTFSIEIEGDLNLGRVPQGSKRGDDFLFRLGLVYEGDRTAGFFERHFAADWVTTLFDLAPENTGIDKIDFYNVYSDPRLANKHREHPLSDLVHENFRFAAPEDGKLSGKIHTHNNERVLALWISSDGDDTDSQYQVRIKEIILE